MWAAPTLVNTAMRPFMKRFTGHTEPWGTFLDVKHWEQIKNPGKYRGKEFFIGSVTDPYNPQEAEYHDPFHVS